MRSARAWILIIAGAIPACAGASLPPESGPGAAAPEGAAPSGPADPLAGGEPPSPCSKNPASEAPVLLGEIGTGSRYIELVNDGEDVELQARLLNDKEQPALKGTLRIPPKGFGHFRIEQGTYVIRYRNQRTCKLTLGEPIVIGPLDSGVRIALTPIFVVGASQSSSEVEGDL